MRLSASEVVPARQGGGGEGAGGGGERGEERGAVEESRCARAGTWGFGGGDNNRDGRGGDSMERRLSPFPSIPPLTTPLPPNPLRGLVGKSGGGEGGDAQWEKSEKQKKWEEVGRGGGGFTKSGEGESHADTKVEMCSFCDTFINEVDMPLRISRVHQYPQER